MATWKHFWKEEKADCDWANAPAIIQDTAEYFMETPVESYGLHSSKAFGDDWHGNLGTYMWRCDELGLSYEEALVYAACPARLDHKIGMIDSEWMDTMGLEPWEKKVRVELAKGVMVAKIEADAIAREELQKNRERGFSIAALVLLAVTIGVILYND